MSVVRGFWIMLATAAFAAAAFYVLREHWAHALGLAPYLLFLACPLMHLFMHRHHHHGAHKPSRPTQQASPR
jgi:hypothetical protein